MLRAGQGSYNACGVWGVTRPRSGRGGESAHPRAKRVGCRFHRRDETDLKHKAEKHLQTQVLFYIKLQIQNGVRFQGAYRHSLAKDVIAYGGYNGT